MPEPSEDAKKQLKEFIQAVIVPALLERWLREHAISTPAEPDGGTRGGTR